MQGFSQEQIEVLMALKNASRDNRVSEYLNHSKTAKFVEERRPWEVRKAYPNYLHGEIGIFNLSIPVRGNV